MVLLDLQGLEMESSNVPGDDGAPRGGDSDLSVFTCHHGDSGLSLLLCDTD